MAIPGIVLAAGASHRFGQNKLLIPLGGHAVLYHALQAALTAPLDPVILVLGYECDKALQALEELRGSPKLRVLKNSHWERGRAESLKLGLAAVLTLTPVPSPLGGRGEIGVRGTTPAHAPGAVVLLGDMPLVTPALIARVAQAFLRAHTLCFPIYRGLPGRPVAIPRELFGEFAQLSGDASGLPILQKYWERAIKIELAPDEEPTQWDIDTPEDLERMLKAL
jgi:molybdenum cofactor cytidylyltransferase